MSKYIELIDKYVIEQRKPSEMSEYGSDMNPPNYIWTDNTGEIVRCEDCHWWIEEPGECSRNRGMWFGNDYCSKGERKHGTEN